MIERIKNAPAEIPRATASTVHYLYLARIPFLGWVTLLALPLLAITIGRPLVLAAYDLSSSGEAFFVAFAGTFAAEAISSSFPKNPVYRNLVWFGIKIGLRKQKGYLRAVSADVETNDPANWKFEEGHVRAASYTFIVVVAYCIITAKQIAPLVALMLLLSLWVLVLAGVTFFWDRYRLPLLVILVTYFWLAGFSIKADHYYRVWTRPSLHPELTPGEIVGRAAQQHRPVVVVAAAGGGIQSAAWTTSVLDQLGKRLKADY